MVKRRARNDVDTIIFAIAIQCTMQMNDTLICWSRTNDSTRLDSYPNIEMYMYLPSLSDDMSR